MDKQTVKPRVNPDALTLTGEDAAIPGVASSRSSRCFDVRKRHVSVFGVKIQSSSMWF